MGQQPHRAPAERLHPSLRPRHRPARPPGTPASLQDEIILDNKVFNFNGTLRYTAFSNGGNNCALGLGGAPCPRSRTAIVASAMPSSPLPQMITGRGIYVSTSATFWTGPPVTLPIIVPPLTNASPSLFYPAIAELESSSPGPEIVVADTMASRLWVVSAGGTVLASTTIPSPGLTNPKCGGPPMIGDADGVPGPEIGVASCTRYTLFKYNPASPRPSLRSGRNRRAIPAARRPRLSTTTRQVLASSIPTPLPSGSSEASTAP